MASTTTELPVSPVGSKSKAGSDALEAEAIGLEISVRIHGSQVAAVVLESTEHVEPFEEDTTTMIVFPRGAVVKLRARVRTGHAMVLTNLATKQTALCRIIQVNTAPNIAHYVKLEFIQPTPGFWSVHFPSDPLPSTRREETSEVGSAPALPTPIKSERIAAEPATPIKPAPIPQVAPAIQKPFRVDTQPVAAKQPARDTVSATLPRDLPLSVPTTEYGNERFEQKEELVPLASGSPALERKTISQARVPAATLAKPKRETRATLVEQPIFDSLTTQEEIFSREEAATGNIGELEQNLARQASTGASRKTIAAIDYSSLLQPSATPKPRSKVLMFAGATVVVLAFVAAGAMYMRRNSMGTTLTSSAAPAPSQSISAPAAATPHPVETSSAATPSSGSDVSDQTLPSATFSAVDPEPRQSSITAPPIRTPSPKSAASMSHPTISTGIANIYAGDLKARVQITPGAAAHMSAPVPDVTASESKEMPITPSGNLGSLVPGAGGSNLVAPAPVKPEPVQGGKVQLPKLISSVAPVYPQLAATNHVEGEVKIQAEINASGRVTSTKAISGPILLRSAAMDAVRQWKYSPALLDGKPIATQYAVTVRFRLNQ